MVGYNEQCKKCFHFQVCAQVMKNQLFIRSVMLKEENPKCEHFIPAADVVEVVRCKDCIYAVMTIGNEQVKCCDMFDSDGGVYLDKNHFCSYGKRKESEET